MQQLFYNSTRGNDSNNLSSQAILKGICTDGGLFVPEHIPSIENINALKNMNYKEIAFHILKKFLTDFSDEEIKLCVNKAYDNKFDCEEITPLKKIDNTYFLELFHGPTLAFKDLALSILPHLLTTAAKKNNLNKNIVILTATSGDTGKAALEGFKDVDNTNIIVFYPDNGVSEIQKLQMVTQDGKNTSVIGLNGIFDDAQTGVKEIFTDDNFKKILDNNNYIFSSANSINIGRLLPQIVYYVYSYCNLLKNEEICSGEKINVVVPTGNFGNILAAYFAKKMRLPINKLICASNDNKVLYEFFDTGTYNRHREFITTISPSMDILISSNLERLLYYSSDENSALINDLMHKLKDLGSYDITEEMKQELNQFFGGYADESKVKKSIKFLFNNHNYLIDTHTAVAYSVYSDYIKNTNDKTKTIIVSTASPYKFAPAVMSSIKEDNVNCDVFQLIDILSTISNTPIPQNIISLKNSTIKHTDKINKSKMKDHILKLLNIKN